MSNLYYYQLDDVSKRRYLEKLEYDGIALPDPLDTDLRLGFYKSQSLKISPNITFGDIYIYLVETEKVYTREEFKYYKNLECYNMVLSGKVRDILAYKCEDTELCVLTCDVQSIENLMKTYRAFVVIASDGVIHNGHCTCMEGLAPICSHVAALLLSLEIAVKKNILYESFDDSYLEKSSKRNNSMPMSEFFENNKYTSTNESNSSNNSALPLHHVQGYKKRLNAIKKIVPNAPIFTLLSDSDLSSNDEEVNENGDEA